MNGDPSGRIDTALRNLGFQWKNGWSLRVGTVEITGGASIRGFSLTFTEIGTRSMSQYETHGPAHTTQEMIGKLIRTNLAMNNASSLPAWDDLQSCIRQPGGGDEL